MNVEENFRRRIKRLRAQALRRSLVRMLGDTLMVALILCAATVVLLKLDLLSWTGYETYPLLVALALAISTLIELRSRRHFMDELIDVDSRFGLREMLSSAYDCERRERRSVFVDLLLGEAAAFLNRMTSGRVLPMRLLRRHAAIPFLALVLVLAITIDLLPARTRLPEQTDAILKRVADQVEKIAKKEEEKEPSKKKRAEKSTPQLSQKLEALKRELRDRTLSRKKALKSLRDLLEEVQREQVGVSKELSEDLSLQNIEGVPSLQPELARGIPQESLSKAESLFAEFFDGDVPDSISEKIMALKRLNETQETINSAMQDMQADSQSASKPGAGKGSGQQSSPSENQEKPSDGSPPQAGEPGDEEEGMEDMEQMSASIAGRGKDKKELDESGEIDESKNVPESGSGLPAPGKRYNVLVRALPMMEKSEIEPEEVIRSYRKEMEEILSNDEIPLNYREYIKNYFLAIGVEGEDQENE
jgi:hypothetical protein